MAFVLLTVVVNGVTLFAQTSGAEGRCDVDLVHGIGSEFSQIIDAEPCVDGTPMRLYGRGGVKFPFKFTAERQHASPQAAADFARTHPRAMPVGVGSASITIGSGSSSYAQGAVEHCSVRVELDRTFTEYSLILALS
jgi:hypothetical protein